jgi:hypothetical protein
MRDMKKFVCSYWFQLVCALGVLLVSIACGLVAKNLFAWSGGSYLFVGLYSSTLAALVFFGLLDKKRFIQNMQAFFTSLTCSCWLIAGGIVGVIWWGLTVCGLQSAEAVLHLAASAVWVFVLLLTLSQVVRVQ